MGETIRPLDEFLGFVNEMCGLHGDCLYGIKLFREQIAAVRKKMLGSASGLTENDLDSKPFFHSEGNPFAPNAKISHTCTQGELVRRNAIDGPNEQLIGDLCLVLLYQYWDDFYRNEIAASLGKKKKDVLVPVMGDLRLLRHSIIHNGGVAQQDVDHCQVLKWFHAGDPIQIDREKFKQMVAEIVRQVSSLVPSEPSAR